MSLMSKLLTSALIATVALSAKGSDLPDNKTLLNYVKKNIVRNPQVKLKGVSVTETATPEELKGWKVLFTTLDLEFRGQEIHVPEMMFVKDGLVTENLVDLKTGKNYRNTLKPKVPDAMYDKAHLLYGNENAAHKIIVFSDPMCPFCRNTVPGIIKAAKEHPDKIALYYYHLPLLQIHPVSGILTRIMHVAQQEGKKDVLEKMYTLKIGFREHDTKKIADAVKKHTGYEVDWNKVNDKQTVDALKADEEAAARMMVRGTPTVYVDGKWDSSRTAYKQFVK